MRTDPLQTEAFLQIIERQGVLDGRFSQIRRINPNGGDGAFSLVCIAVDLTNGQEVVLKFFDPDCRESYRRESFIREAETLAKFAGARDIIGLVSGISEFRYKPDPLIPLSFPFTFYALEKAEGSVEDAIASDAWSPRESLIAMRSMARAVQYMHARHTAHRDLKPGNFLITESGVKLSDLGTARSMLDPGILSRYPGPPGDTRYAPPEMIACLHDVDPRFAMSADFFALGAILFELFTGVNLGVRLFSPVLVRDLSMSMMSVDRAHRVEIFNQFVGQLSAKYSLPKIQALNPSIPGCIRQRVENLFRGLCSLDYRNRICTFSPLFLAIDSSLLILDNEAKYLAWRKERQRRRAVRMQRKTGVSI